MNGATQKPLLLVIDVHSWIERVDHHMSNPPECLNGMIITSDMVVGDAFKAALFKLDDCYDYLHFDTMDYIFSAVEEVNPGLVIDDFVYEHIHGWMNEAMEVAIANIHPYAKMVADSNVYRNAGHWSIYRVSNTRFVVEVGDGTRTFDQYYFRQGPFLRKDGSLEDHWLVR